MLNNMKDLLWNGINLESKKPFTSEEAWMVALYTDETSDLAKNELERAIMIRISATLRDRKV